MQISNRSTYFILVQILKVRRQAYFYEMAPKHEYTDISIGDSDSEAPHDEKVDEDVYGGAHLASKTSKTRSKLVHTLLLLSGVIIGIILSLVAPRLTEVVFHRSRYSSHTFMKVNGTDLGGTQCGDSWEDAVRMGCHYDVMASRWYSEECFDQSVLDGMLSEPQVNYTWFSDKRHTQQVSTELAYSGKFDALYPLYDYHIAHCLYLWRRLHYAVIHNRPIDDDLFAYEHTIHFTRMILEWHDPTAKKTLTAAHARSPFCRSNPLGILSR